MFCTPLAGQGRFRRHSETDEGGILAMDMLRTQGFRSFLLTNCYTNVPQVKNHDLTAAVKLASSNYNPVYIVCLL